MAKNKLVTPFLKWVGGKRQLLPAIVENLPKNYSEYCEPFIGGGAVFLSLQPKAAIINDLNSELINVYNVVKNNLEELLIDLGKHKNEVDYFYKIRSLDRTQEFDSLSDVQKASRVIYLNKTCYNGLYRVNSAGEFNSPFGKYSNPNIVNETTLRAVSAYLNKSNIKIENKDYLEVLKGLKKNALVYFDPPYHPASPSSNFTGYTQGGFDESEQIRLKEACDALHKKGIKFLLSNSATPFIENLYADYTIIKVKANRAINSNAEKRGEVDEVLVKNYD